MAIDVGSAAPDFTLSTQDGEEIALSSFRGVKSVVLVFYPFAFTGVCTGELAEIRDNIADFRTDDTELLAISTDTMFSLRAFAESERLDFPLLSDFWPHGKVARAYGVFNEAVGAAIRGTFVIDSESVVRWKVENALPDARDVDEYRAALREL